MEQIRQPTNVRVWICCTAVVLLLAFFIFSCKKQTEGISTSDEIWVGTWTTSPQLVEPHNMPPAPGLTDNTLRQVVYVSIGGERLRVKFSNEFSTSPVTMNAVHIALSAGRDTIDADTDMELLFNGQSQVTMEPGTAVTSDPFDFSLEPMSNVTITIYFGETSADVTGHPGSRTTSFIVSGNEVSSVTLAGRIATDHWYVINGIDVIASKSAAAVVTLGNSITDGKGSGTNEQNRWPDELSRRLRANPGTQQVAVLNAGIGGNCVLPPCETCNCLGPIALDRFDRDVLGQSGVRWLIILEGVNDIGQAEGAEGADSVAAALIEAYEQMIDRAHAEGVLVYGATILPFGYSGYYDEEREVARSTVNEWIRTSGRFDAFIDLDAALRRPDNPIRLLFEYDMGDHLHTNEAGHRAMAEAVDLSLFSGN